MPKEKHGMRKDENEAAQAETVTAQYEYAEPTTTDPNMEVVVTVTENTRRIIKLPFDDRIEATRTMYLVEDGKKRPITNSMKAGALGIKVEVVTQADLDAIPTGEPY